MGFGGLGSDFRDRKSRGCLLGWWGGGGVSILRMMVFLYTHIYILVLLLLSFFLEGGGGGVLGRIPILGMPCWVQGFGRLEFSAT